MADIEWLTFPGVTMPPGLEGDSWPTYTTIREMFKNLPDNVVSFIKESVVSFDGNEEFTTVACNARSPVWHIINLPIAEFRKHFFA